MSLDDDYDAVQRLVAGLFRRTSGYAPVSKIIPGFDGPYVRDPRPIKTTVMKEQTPVKSFDQMSLDELHDAADRFLTRYHFVPNSEQLRQFVNDELWYVQCAFANTKATYTYRVNPGDPVSVGDYLRVWSPMTDRHELVRVMEIGRGSWSGHTKTAQRVRTEPID
jgi:hypothetical protein